MNPNGQTLSIHGHDLYVEVNGPDDGLPVVLLHHGLGSIKAWQAQVPFLAEAGYRVIAYDRWGNGESSFRPNLSIPFFEGDLADLLAVLDHLEVQKAHLVGHSDGGTIALYFSAQHPERVLGLAVIAAHIYVEPMMVPGLEAVREVFEQNERFRLGLQRVHGDKFSQVFQNWYSGWKQEHNSTWDMRPELSAVSSPVLVVQGLDDEYASPAHARDLAAALPRADLWLVPEVGHMVPQDHGPEFNHRLLDFLQKVEQQVLDGS